MRAVPKAKASSSIQWLERILSRRLPLPVVPQKANPLSFPLKDGMTIAVVGGGMAGPLFARQLLKYTAAKGPAVRVVILDQTGCNYCAGLMTSLARKSLLDLCGLTVPAEVILTYINSCVYLNAAGHSNIEIKEPLISMLRTDRFGEAGFDNALKYRLLTDLEDGRGRLEIIEPVTVGEVQIPTAKAKGWVGYRHQGKREKLEADIVVMTSGLRSLERPMMNDFIAQTGFIPPKLMEACVFEVDATNAKHNFIGGRALIVDNVLPDCVIGIIPKRPHWLTVSALHRRLAPADLDILFAHPALRRWIELPNPAASLRCNIICPARVFISPAKNLVGDGWLMLGDLTGYGRVLKDGYLACILGADLAARCLVSHGASAEALGRHYQAPLAKTFSAADNRAGMELFFLNERLSRKSWFPSLLLEAAVAEESRAYGGFLHAGLRSLFTGELSYGAVRILLTLGLMNYYGRHPIRFLRKLFSREENDSTDSGTVKNKGK